MNDEINDVLESEIEQLITLEARHHNSHLMRNNSGAFTDSTGRTVRYGLNNLSKKQNDEIKSSDRIGFTLVTITPEMIGKTIAVFTAVEIKRSKWMEPINKRERAQQHFIEWVKLHGGIAMFANSVASFKAGLVDFIQNLKKT